MISLADWQWEFRTYVSREEGTPVLDWFKGIPRNHQIEIQGFLRPIRNMTRRAWGKPFFDPLDGEGGISEIKIVPEIRDDSGVAHYRLYGCFGPGKQKYTFLHCVNKNVKNDREGKSRARFRLEQLRINNAKTIRCGV